MLLKKKLYYGILKHLKITGEKNNLLITVTKNIITIHNYIQFDIIKTF